MKPRYHVPLGFRPFLDLCQTGRTLGLVSNESPPHLRLYQRGLSSSTPRGLHPFNLYRPGRTPDLVSHKPVAPPHLESLPRRLATSILRGLLPFLEEYQPARTQPLISSEKTVSLQVLLLNLFTQTRLTRSILRDLRPFDLYQQGRTPDPLPFSNKMVYL